MFVSLSLVVGTPALQNMKRHMCTHTQTLTSDAQMFVIYVCLVYCILYLAYGSLPAAFLFMPSSYGLLPMPYYQWLVACESTCRVYPIRKPSQGTLDDKPAKYPHMGLCMFGGRRGHETHAPHITDQHNLGIRNYIV